jgi:hypothetical protein
MNRLEIEFLKNCDLKTQKTVFSNRSKCGVFFKTQNFKDKPTILKAKLRFC